MQAAIVLKVGQISGLNDLHVFCNEKLMQIQKGTWI